MKNKLSGKHSYGKKHQACGHINKGSVCRRCEFAAKLDAMVTAGTQLITNKKLKPKKWSKKEMQDEAERLREGTRRL